MRDNLKAPTKRQYPCSQWATRICYPSNFQRYMPCDKHRSQWMQSLLSWPPLRPEESYPKRHAWPWTGPSCHRPSEPSASVATPNAKKLSNCQTELKKICDVKLYTKLPTSHSSGSPSWNFNFPKQVSYSSLVVMPSGTFANDIFPELQNARSPEQGPKWSKMAIVHHISKPCPRIWRSDAISWVISSPPKESWRSMENLASSPASAAGLPGLTWTISRKQPWFGAPQIPQMCHCTFYHDFLGALGDRDGIKMGRLNHTTRYLYTKWLWKTVFGRLGLYMHIYIYTYTCSTHLVAYVLIGVNRSSQPRPKSAQINKHCWTSE